MNTMKIWVNSVQELLFRLKDLDLGYPLGINRILAPQDCDTVENGLLLAQAGNLEDLKLFYNTCDGVSLLDVHAGYFIKSITNLGVVDRSSEPIEIKEGDFTGEILSFGSTGGGGLFVLRRTYCDVLYLAPGPLDNGTYDGGRGSVKLISSSFFGFLECLLADIRAFVNNESNHRFIC